MLTVSMPGRTRDRILDAAMQLFGENGFRGTSVARIERAAGLAPGAGGIYHHFESKDAVLEAGVARDLERLGATCDFDRFVAGCTDLRAGLTAFAWNVIATLDAEQQLVRIMAAEARSRPHLLEDAGELLFCGAFAGFTQLLLRESDLSLDRADAVAAAALGALATWRLVPNLFGVSPTRLGDEAFVQTWVEMISTTLAG